MGTRTPVSRVGAGLLPIIHLYLVIRGGTECLFTTAPMEFRAIGQT